ncbi:DEAD/DEAH box helicase [Methylovirgula sp. 4M-Z18]|uniref:DEAD/DEAH box helicase n=1 Tax=Methylovirgula sp. 4M-Z18 TaxID=2293567 RepID=UPI000E2ED786|nr:DEAD/DEAH box helicase [Methylovirgula sp. 4M-Z18]RFB78747.1 DEAD/DEAH box helicase [Methylovirgula sp. 4M-Z18]
MSHFQDLGLVAPLLKALSAEGYTNPTPIQAQAIPFVLAGHDLLGIAQTGTGKTAAFALPILNHLAKTPKQRAPRTARVLVLSPTRELASQILDSFRAYGRNLKLDSTVIFGGVPISRQVRAAQNGHDIVVATPGRLVDLVSQRALSLSNVEILVLDEADQMLDMGFIRDIKRLVALLPKQRQNLFFSATMPKEIAELANELLRNPQQVAVTPVATTAERVDQQVIFCDQPKKQALLHKLLEDKSIARALVFARTKHGADKIVRHLGAAGFIADAIHGNKSQGQRERALAAFRNGKSRLLVATDIAARGIDVDGVTHVINYDLPNVPESYVHRIGRTARAGAAGIAISFCGHDERAYLRDIERTTRQRVPAVDNPLGSEAGASLGQETEQAPRPQGQRPFGGHKAGGKPGQQQRRRFHGGKPRNAGERRASNGQ